MVAATFRSTLQLSYSRFSLLSLPFVGSAENVPRQVPAQADMLRAALRIAFSHRFSSSLVFLFQIS